MRKKDAARGKEGSSPHCAAGVISGALTELAAMGQAGGAPTNGNGSHGGLGMGHTVSHRRGVVAVAAMVVALLVWPVTSEAQLGDLTGTITGTNIGADFVMSRALAVVDGASGVSNIDGLTINGIPIPVTGDPNQTIGIAGGVLIINEQQVGSDGTMVVNALHAVVSGIADV